MFKIAQYQAAEIALARQVTALEELKNDPELKRELEFNAELETLLAKYSLNKTKLHSFMSAQQAAIKASEKRIGSSSHRAKGASPTAKMKLWTNPHTNEQVESARRDHKTLLEWQEQYGLDTVLSWAVSI